MGPRVSNTQKVNPKLALKKFKRTPISIQTKHISLQNTCSGSDNAGSQIFNVIWRLDMRGKKGCVSLEQTARDLNWATHTGARLGDISTVETWPCWVGLLAWFTPSIPEELQGCRQLVLNGKCFASPTSLPSRPPCSNNFWNLGRWKRQHHAL